MHKRADRALKLVQMGELSVGRLDVDGAEVVVGDNAACLRSSRRGAAAGFRNVSSHFVISIGHRTGQSLIFRIATVLARGHVPSS